MGPEGNKSDDNDNKRINEFEKNGKTGNEK